MGGDARGDQPMDQRAGEKEDRGGASAFFKTPGRGGDTRKTVVRAWSRSSKKAEHKSTLGDERGE